MTGGIFPGEVRSRTLIWVFAAAVPAILGVLLVGLFFGEWWHVAGYVWYLLPGTFVPQEPSVIYAGTIYHPGFVVLIFCLATTTAAIVDYFTVKKVLAVRKFDSLKKTSFYQSSIRCFYWRPWWTIAVFAFSPLPFFPIRILALSSNYSAFRYVSANVVGRAPRYYLLAIGGAWLAIPLMYVLLIGLTLALIPLLLGMYLSRRNTESVLSTAA